MLPHIGAQKLWSEACAAKREPGVPRQRRFVELLSLADTGGLLLPGKLGRTTIRGSLEKDQIRAVHESPRTNQTLCAKSNQLSLDEKRSAFRLVADG